MRAKEFITENKKIQEPHPDVYNTLPHSYALPGLKNQDPYKQYRFGVLIAGEKGAKQRDQDNIPHIDNETAWGENEIVIGYGIELDGYIDSAMKMMGVTKKVQTSSKKSVEPGDTSTTSPIKPFKGYK